MYLRFKILSLATLLLAVTLPPNLNFSPLVVQAQTTQDRKTTADILLKEGISLYNRINLGGALGKFESALLIYQEIGDQAGIGTTFHQIGLVYDSKKEYQKASDYYQRALEFQRTVDDAGAKITLYRIGKIYDKIGDYQQALDYYQQALAVRQEIDDTKNSKACNNRAWTGITFNGIGRVYQRLSNYQQSLDYYQQAVAIQQELSNCAAQDIPSSYDRGATLFYNTGLVAQELGKFQQALDSYQQALAIYQELNEGDQQWEMLNKIGVIYRKMGEYQQALAYFQKAQKMNVFLGSNFGQGGAFNNIGLVHYDLGEYQQALDFYQKALAFAQKISDRAGEGVTLNNIGTVYDKLGKSQQALDSYQQALAIFQEVGDKKSAGITLNNIGLVYNKLGEYDQAFNYYQQVLAIRQEIGGKVGEEKQVSSITLNLEPLILQKLPKVAQESEELKLYQKGIQLSKQGQYQEALKRFQQALIIAREIGDQAREWKNLNQIGLVYNSLGEYKLALDFFNQALIIPKNVFENTGAINYNIGLVYSSLGDYSKALEFYQQASALAKKLSNKAGEVRIINTIGNVHAKLGKYDLALNSYQQALTLLKTIDFEKKLLEGATLNNIGQVYREQGKSELALDYYQQALRIQKQFGSQAGEGIILDNIGEAYYNLGQYKTALEYYQQALVISQEIGEKAREAENLSNIGYLLEKQNQPELAIVFFKQSVNVREEIRNNIKQLTQAQQQFYTKTIAEDYRHLADILLKQDRLLEAQRVLDLLKVQELDDYLRNVRGTRGTAQGVPNLASEQQIEDGYQAILDQAITLGKELTQLRQKSNRTSEDEQRIAQLVKAQETIRVDFNNFIKSPEVIALITQRSPETLSQDLLLRMGDFNALQDNLKNLQQKAVLFYPLILDDRIELILTTPDSPPIRRTVQVTKKQLNETIVAFRRALQSPVLDAKIPAQQLYNWLIKPIEAELKAADAQTIIYAPDSQLRYIPLAALYDGEQWLVQRYRINNITAASLTDLNTKSLEKSDAGTSLRILAGAFASGSYSVKVRGESFNFDGLPFAGVEVKNLAKTIPNTTQFFDQAFTPQATIPKMDDYNIVHLATHAAFVVGTPEDSFILFGNGERVTLRDIQKWSLKNVDLVVLSACETGLGGKLGNGEEILGLGYQMQQAGARAAIASLWTVDDGGTQALMDGFYAFLKPVGQTQPTKAEALRQAQIALITNNYTALGKQRGLEVQQRIQGTLPAKVTRSLRHPFYWAPFILIGNGL
ncbi:MAG: tetratricopeptide repeat protein [Coleofasciculaceae cyanobacterium]